MAITLIEPNTLNFAENPIVFKATTDKSLASDESMLRIVCKVSFQAVDRTGMQFNVELSQPVEDGGTAVFNFSDAAQTLIKRIHAEMDMNGSDALSHIGLHGYVGSCNEVWIKDGYEVSGQYPASSGRFYVVPGRLTDYEMLSMSTIDLTTLASGRPMTRKPDAGIVYRGETIILPTLSTGGGVSTLSVSVGGSTVASSGNSLTGYALDYQSVSVSSSAEGKLSVSSTFFGGEVFSGYYRANTNGVHFLRFINGFGAVENIAVRAKEKLSYEVSGETHSLVQEISTRPTDRRYATKSQPVGVYELSSGYVPQKWAEWYVQELLTSPRVWIQLGGKWVPALIESEDDCVIYDRTKPEMPHVDFTLRLAIDGVTGCTW